MALRSDVEDHKQLSATFGPPRGQCKPSPSAYLRKHALEPQLPAPVLPTTTKLKRLTLKHPVPSRTDRPPKKAKADTDFITTNALKTIHAKPSRLSDEPPRYIDKPDFGRVPDYLIQTKKTLKEAAEHFSATQTMKAQQEQDAVMTRMSQEERDQLLRQLKTQWGALNSAFQKLPLTVDSPSMLRRRESLEAQLAQTESDIQLIQQRETVMILMK